ncbi:hypothetical protein [Alteromonas sp. C1M14]|uniref:hypothetical protein n=1 Tax=Alteromonas sp. C1M14 TaxID=2841567 RepID=UPI001C09C493|nr:hypothetical protein [Alteromonas sp. C1M14]MBU2978809.1 hypothetical protein [Alteromonas sp. C1M14]
MKYVVVLSLSYSLFGCASGKLDMFDTQGQKIGECTAGYKWHLIGAEASRDWLLNYCVETAKSEGDFVFRVSDQSILEKDYSYPSHPSGLKWTRKLAWDAYWSDLISEREYGYIVAELENVFFLRSLELENELQSGEISRQQYTNLMKKAESAFHGK